MNITYIIGNGFDLRFGLPTSYADFAQYYAPELCKKADKTELSELCRRIRSLPRPRSEEDLMQLFLSTSCDSNWSDLEIHLGKFTNELDQNEFIPFYCHLNRELDNYLQKIEKASNDITDNEKTLFHGCLYNPFIFYTVQDEEFIRNNYFGRTKYETVINFITFNYTSTLERLSYGLPILYENDYWRTLRLNEAYHIHGELNHSGILFGVDNIDQIANQDFWDNREILDLLIKPDGNEAIGDLIDEDCLNCINNTHIFFIFGTSLGETDYSWWNFIGSRFREEQSVLILLFEYNPELKGRLRQQQRHSKEEIKGRLLKTLGLDPNEDSLRERIFISLNSEMFPKRDRMPIPAK